MVVNNPELKWIANVRAGKPMNLYLLSGAAGKWYSVEIFRPCGHQSAEGRVVVWRLNCNGTDLAIAVRNISYRFLTLGERVSASSNRASKQELEGRNRRLKHEWETTRIRQCAVFRESKPERAGGAGAPVKRRGDDRGWGMD
jgi:hypothetical protein